MNNNHEASQLLAQAYRYILSDAWGKPRERSTIAPNNKRAAAGDILAGSTPTATVELEAKHVLPQGL